MGPAAAARGEVQVSKRVTGSRDIRDEHQTPTAAHEPCIHYQVIDCDVKRVQLFTPCSCQQSCAPHSHSAAIAQAAMHVTYKRCAQQRPRNLSEPELTGTLRPCGKVVTICQGPVTPQMHRGR
jgi:hypothetical protein